MGFAHVNLRIYPHMPMHDLFIFLLIIFKYKNNATYVRKEAANHGSEGGRGKMLLSALELAEPQWVQRWGEEAEIPGLTQEDSCSNNPKCSTQATSP